MITSPTGFIVFASAEDAEFPVAGLPAAARAIHAAHAAQLPACWIDAGPGWQPSDALRREIDRLAVPMPVHFGRPGPEASAGAPPPPASPATSSARMRSRERSEDYVAVIAGDRLPDADAIRRAIGDAGHVGAAGAAVRVVPCRDGAGVAARFAADGGTARARLAQAGRAVIRATAKPTDGVVSRYINRPISQTISALLLRLPAMRPLHATVGTGLIALAMFAALALGGAPGLFAGAVLFQCASIFDGVDGEIARATFRTSPDGARIDSLVDAVTNLSFVLGTVINLHIQGYSGFAAVGLAGLGLLGTGLWMIGRAAARRQAPFGFDAVKEYYRGSRGGRGPSPVMQVLTYVTSRDFFALAIAVLVGAGLAPAMLALFATMAAGWLIAVTVALRRGDA